MHLEFHTWERVVGRFDAVLDSRWVRCVREEPSGEVKG